MPSIDYSCRQCGAWFKQFVFLGDADQLPVCPKCKSPHVEEVKTEKSLFQGISNQSNLAGDRN